MADQDPFILEQVKGSGKAERDKKSNKKSYIQQKKCDYFLNSRIIFYTFSTFFLNTYVFRMVYFWKKILTFFFINALNLNKAHQ